MLFIESIDLLTVDFFFNGSEKQLKQKTKKRKTKKREKRCPEYNK